MCNIQQECSQIYPIWTSTFFFSYLGVSDDKGYPAGQEKSAEDDGGHVFEHGVHRCFSARWAGLLLLERMDRRVQGALILHPTFVHLLFQNIRGKEKWATMNQWAYKEMPGNFTGNNPIINNFAFKPVELQACALKRLSERAMAPSSPPQ